VLSPLFLSAGTVSAGAAADWLRGYSRPGTGCYLPAPHDTAPWFGIWEPQFGVSGPSPASRTRFGDLGAPTNKCRFPLLRVLGHQCGQAASFAAVPLKMVPGP